MVNPNSAYFVLLRFILIILIFSPYPGLGRPFNFFGHVGRIQLESLQEQLSKVSSPPSRRIILSHYPINTMLFSQSSGSHDTHSTYRNFAHLSQKVSIYLSGHLHNLASNIGEHLYAIRKPFSLLDLEVGDLKDNGMFRLGVFDDELNPGNNFSFSDYSLLRKSSGRGEIILSKNNDITSDDSIFAHVLHPKDGRFLREGPQDFIFNNEFQILLFGKDSKKITSLKVYLNGARVVNELIKKLDDQLSLHKFTFLFEALPRNISYILRVDLESSDSSLLYRHEHTFRLDGQAVPMTEIGSFFMTFRFQLFFRILFWISFALLFIGALIIPKIIKLSSAEYSLSRTGLFANLKSIKHRSISSMILLNEENLFFFPWLLYLLYLPVGPLFSGHLITFDTSQVFHFFLIGIQVINEGSFTKTDRTQWLPLLDTWEFTSFFLLSFVLPAWSLLLGRVFVLSSTTGKNVQFQTSAKRKSSRLKSMSSLSEEEPPSHGNFRFAIRFILYYGFHLVIAFWWLIHGCLLCLLGVSYGILPFLFSPGLLWFYLYNLALYYWILPRRILSHEL